MQDRVFIGLLIGIGSYTCLYLGKGIQKYAIEGIKERKSLKTRHSGTWIFGTVLTALPVFIQWAALAYAPVNVIAPLEGLGLVVLLLFSRFVLKESFGILDIIGAGVIISGLVLISWFNTNTSEIIKENVSLNIFIIFIGCLAAGETAAILVSRRYDYRFGGVIIGFTAGTLMAFQTLSKRISIISDYRLLGTTLTFIFAPLTLGVTQFGFAKADAGRVVPAFTVASVILATLIGSLALSERITALQVPGIVMVAAGIIMITAMEEKVKTG